MDRRISWVELLAIGLLIVAVGVCFSGAEFLRIPHASDDRQTAAMREAFAPLAAIFYGATVAVVALSLFLVSPLLRLGPRAPLWLIPLAGVLLGIVILVKGSDSVCLGFGRDLFFACDFGLWFLCPVLIVLGTVVLIRRAQVFRKRHTP